MKVQLPFHNHAAGRSGGSIFQTYWGRTFARSMPALFHYPDTKPQQETQAKFFSVQYYARSIYNLDKSFISRYQRININAFDVYMKAFFAALNPYNRSDFVRPPKYFGVDKYNSAILPTKLLDVYMSSNRMAYEFQLFEPIVKNSNNFIYQQAIFFNRTKQICFRRQGPYTKGMHNLTIMASSQWSKEDEIYIYFALQSTNWQGNYNLTQI